MIKLLTVLFWVALWASVCLGFGRFIAYAFDVPDQYLRQGYHQCDAPSGWCDNEREEKPCGENR